MTHQTQVGSREIMPGIPVPDLSTLPSILKKKGDIYDIVTQEPVSVGDEVFELYSGTGIVVKKVISTRPAKGDWENTTYKDKNPIWSQVEIKR